MLTITIDGNEVALTGSSKGDGVYEALKHTAWKWSRPTGGFVLPRNLLPHTRERNINQAKTILTGLGFEVEVEDTGTVLTVADEREQSVERLTNRAERYERTAEVRGAEALRRDAAEHALLDPIPLGQPNINGRLTPVLKRAEQHRVAASKAADEAEHAAARAEGLRRALEGTPQVTLLRRIERYETEIRDLDRRLNGTSVASNYGHPATGDYRERLLTMRQRAQEALALDIAERDRRAEEQGVKVWTREDFQKGDEALTTFGWAKVLRVNAKTVTVPHPMAPDALTWTRPYAEIKGRRRDGVVTK